MIDFASTGLPVAPFLPEIAEKVSSAGGLVLRAEPGAGKTSLVPLALAYGASGAAASGAAASVAPAGTAALHGKVLVLEPRRVAAVQAASRAVELLEASAGPGRPERPRRSEVGYRVRGDSRPGSRIEFLTPGVFLRMIQSDPALAGVSCVVFDEFHERSLEADLALALLLEARVLAPGLRLLLMSATLDAGRAASFVGLPSLEVPGRAYPVETSYRPVDQGRAFAAEVAAAAASLSDSIRGDLLVFLPGLAEIGAVGRELAALGRASTPLHASLPLEEQRRVIRPPSAEAPTSGVPTGTSRFASSEAKRRIILATSIAETSLTVPGVVAVLDSGLARLSRYDARTGLNRLVTEREAQDRADQRRGRAGRLGPGRCLRLWAESERLPEATGPEILRAELSGLILEAAVWGASPSELPFLDAPPQAALEAGRELLEGLGALDSDGKPTELGREAARLGAEPRLAVLVLRGAEAGRLEEAAGLAAILEEGIPAGPGGSEGGDLGAALAALEGRDPRYGRAREERSRLLAAARSWAGGADLADAPRRPAAGLGPLLAAGFPDRVAKRVERGPDRAVFQLPGGRKLAARPPLSAEAWIVVADADSGGAEGLKPGRAPGSYAEGRVFSGAALSEAEALAALGPLTKVSVELDWEGLSCRARRRLRAGSILLSETALGAPPQATVAAALAERVGREGLAFLPWAEAGAGALLARMRWFGRALPDEAWPELTESALREASADWLSPFAAAGPGPVLSGEALRQALEALIPPGLRSRFAREAPARLELPSGRSFALDYEAALAASTAESLASPSLEARVEELFGLAEGPRVAGRPLSLVLLSPARRPLQITSDLAGFWAGAWKEVRKELRGRYPKHDWPEDPARASPPPRRPPHKR